ncbi:MAG: hypothetical protein HQ522_06710 [Bacteroidetes bacterium]|nr:hypothetical protein [Bacteroidota bacterium]
MGKRNSLSLILFLFTLILLGESKSPTLKEQIDWGSFLSHHDLVWEKTPDDYFNAPFLGNGLLGAMLYAPKGEKFRLDIGRTDVVEHRKSDARSIIDNDRLPVGHFTLEMNYDGLKDSEN